MTRRLPLFFLTLFFCSSISYAQSQKGDVNYFVNSNNVKRIVRDGDNLWIASFGGGLIKFNITTRAKTQYLRSNSGIPTHLLNDIALGKDGKIWLATNGKGITCFDGASWSQYTKEHSGLTSNYISKIVVDQKGIVWAGSDNGLMKYDNGLWSVIREDDFFGKLVSTLAVDSSNRLLIGLSSNSTGLIARLHNDTLDSLPPAVTPFINLSLKYLEVDKQGSIWAAGQAFSLFRFKNGKWKGIDALDGQPSNVIYDVSGVYGLTASDSGAWITTQYSLFHANAAVEYDTIITYDAAPTFPRSWGAMIDVSGSLYFSSSQGLCRFDRKSSQTFSISNGGFGSNNVKKIRISLSGDVWFAAGGVHSLSKGKWGSFDVTKFTGKFDGEGITWFNENIEDIVLKGDSLACAIIGFNGFIRYGEPFSRLYFSIRDSDLMHHTYMGIDGGDSIYIAANYGLRAFHNDSLYPYTIIGDTIKFANVNDMIFDKEGTLWFGNIYYGASKFNFTSGWETYRNWEKTLPFRSVFDFEMDSTGTLWGATDSGLVKYNYANDSWDLYRVPSALIDKPDLKAIAIESPTSIYACAGVLYFNETKLLHFDGSEWSEVVVSGSPWPEFGIEGIVLDKQGNLWMNTLHEGALVYRKGGPVLDVKREYQKGSTLSLTIFPSPAEDHIRVQLPEGVHAKSLSIIDILGREVMTSDGINESISISSLPSGYYKVICRSPDGVTSGSFVK